MKQLSIIFLVLVSSSTFARYFPPANIQKDIERLEILNSKCRGGSGDNPQTWKACNQRESLEKKIEKNGWCWGANFENAAGYQKYWLPCKLNKN